MNRDVLHGLWIQLTSTLRGRCGWVLGDSRSVAMASLSFRLGRTQSAYGRARVGMARKVVLLERELSRELKV